MRPIVLCHDGLCVEIESRKRRNEGLPKREPPCSEGGQESIISSTEERIEIMEWTIGAADERETEDNFLSTADSERAKTNERMRE